MSLYRQGLRKIDIRNSNYDMVLSKLVLALAKDYIAIYVINTESEHYWEYSTANNKDEQPVFTEGENFSMKFMTDIPGLHPDDRDMMETLKKDNIVAMLSESGSISLTYRRVIDGITKHINLIGLMLKNDPEHIIIGIRNIDELKRIENDSETYRHIAGALASRYEFIYYIDVDTNSYIELNSNGSGKLTVTKQSVDFFADAPGRIDTYIYEDDRERVASAMQKDTLIGEINEHGSFTMTYRQYIGGRPQYLNLFAVRAADDPKHIAIGVINVDASKRKEIDFESALGNAMAMANRDPLTGVMNKRAYAQLEMQLDKQINSKTSPEFAVVLCDINGLKQVNDTKGHNAGDKYIKEACELICGAFQNSPVFRIGGDEFVVVLTGGDYENRAQLLRELDEMQKDNPKNGRVSFAYGISDHDEQQDMRMQDVFERADIAMYENKRLFKSGYELSQDSKTEFERTITFYELYAQLVSAMAVTETKEADVPLIEKLLNELAKMFRLSRGVIRTYRNPGEEKTGRGETIPCFEIGKGDKEALTVRMVSSVMSIGTITVYLKDGESDLTDDERWKVELVMRTTLSFVSTSKMRGIVEELAFYDDDGYPNLRNLTHYFMNMDTKDKVAINYSIQHFSLFLQEIGKEKSDRVLLDHFNKMKALIGERGKVSRLGGDTFVAICDRSQLDDVIDLLSETSVVYGNSDEERVDVSTAAGVFCLPEGYVIRNPGDIMTKIIMAMRAAQSNGIENIVYYDEKLISARESAMKIQQHFSEGLKNREFKAFYQPKVDIVTGELSGAEALCRWFRNGKMVPPNEFIPVLEETNEICKLDFYMLDQACRDIRRWLDEGRNVVRISVNFSRNHMTDKSLVKSITSIIDKHKIPHEYIEIELTETMTDVGFSDLKRVVNELQEADLSISVDDFGVGYSSINLICDIPWDVIKIDKSLLPLGKDSSEGPRGIMFRHVLAMASQLGLECVAEGVETQDQLEILRENKCAKAQGFLFDRPLTCEDFEKRMLSPHYEA